MLYLNALTSYLPVERRPVAHFAEELQLSPQSLSTYDKVYGLQDIALAENENLRDLLDNALARILAASAVDRKQIKYIFHCHAAPNTYPPEIHLLRELKKKHGLQHAIGVGAALDQCATSLTVLNLADVLLAQEPDDNAKVLVLTGEVGFHERLRHIPNTTIMGDAAAACLVGKKGERNAVLASAQRKFELAGVTPGAIPLPVGAKSYGDDLIQVVKDALKRAGLGIGDIALILIHNVNTISWKFFARNFPCPLNVIYMNNVPKSGHCFTSDPFINYCDAVREGRLKIGDYFLMVSVGTSSTFAAVVVKH